jgi:hypothetical protein
MTKKNKMELSRKVSYKFILLFLLKSSCTYGHSTHNGQKEEDEDEDEEEVCKRSSLND